VTSEPSSAPESASPAGQPAADSPHRAPHRAVRHRLPRRYRRRPKRPASGLSSWLGWLVLACVPPLVLLAVDRLDLRPPESQDFVDAKAMHQDLVQRYQLDAYTRPEAKSVIARLERVPSSSRNYAEAQDLLRRYRWEAERAPVKTEETPAESHAEASDARPRPTPAYADLDGRLASVIRPAKPEGFAATAPPEGVPDREPPAPLRPSGWHTFAPSKSKEDSQEAEQVLARTTSDRELAARTGLKCFTAIHGSPIARDGARFDVRIDTDPSLRMGGLRVRNLRDLREAAHRLVASDAALAPLDSFLAQYSEDSLTESAVDLERGGFWLWVDTASGPTFVDLLDEAARCQHQAPDTAPGNARAFAPGASAGTDAASLALPVDGGAGNRLEVRWPQTAGNAVELVLATSDRTYPIGRFALPSPPAH